MKTKLILIAGLLSLLAIFIISHISPVYSQDDPKCENCTLTSCDPSCKDKGVCDENGSNNCSKEMGKTHTSSGVSSNSNSSVSGSNDECTNCTLTTCDESCLPHCGDKNCKNMKTTMDTKGK